ncbi:D-alanyl-D-alanine carboxypeptidase/D-alanyl-D-alanine endopeptidase, partial [Streptomyces sp. KR80]|uniref:D-alanyl-D-alanine carboxypeptidase/D-alanyl-D-alanine endopeptidase n=1 Tax=Streptomyces sp. KR80 TaxID=3457426 RepID=UPI003FD28071
MLSGLVGLAIALCAVTAAGPWDSGQRTAEREFAAVWDRGGGEHHGERHGGRSGKAAGTAPSAAVVLPALGNDTRAASPDPVPPPTENGLADALAPLLRHPALGAVHSAAVVDATTGRQLYGAEAARAVVPASTIKIATAVAALDALGPDHRIETTVVQGAADDEVVLVGGGDPTLTARRTPDGAGPKPASLRDLAAQTARALKDRGTRKVTVAYDTSRYTGPDLHPIGPNPNIARVTPLMADEGRRDGSSSGPAEREGDPAAAAARTFADRLRDRGIAVSGDPHSTTAGARAERLAAVRSLPLSALVERMLTVSDNDIAEALARQTALADGEPASFKGGEQAITSRLRKLGLPLSGARFADGSGLSRDDKVSAALLAQLLVRAAEPDRPELRAALTGLPVAGFNGTLRSRYADAPTGTGMVRAKTGTLTGVNALAGTVVD